MRVARVIGDNIKLLLQKNGIKKNEFAKKMGYSLGDVDKICDGRLFVTDIEVGEIASFFDVTKEEICQRGDEKQYIGCGFMECMGTFKKESNRDKVLDIFDMYCDLQETLSE